MDPNDHSTLPTPEGNPQQSPQQPAADFSVPPRTSGQPSYGALPVLPQSQYGQARRPNPFAQAQNSKPYVPEKPLYPQPTYETPFRPAPQHPNYPYQPVSENPAPNPYQVNAQLPEAYNAPKRQSAPIPTPDPYEMPLPSGHSRKFKIIITLVVLLMLAIAATLGYLYYNQSQDDKKTVKKPVVTQPKPKEEPAKEEPKTEEPAPQPQPTPQPAPTPQPVTLGLSDFRKATFGAPSSVPEGYKPFDYKTPGVAAYVTDGRRCELQYGILSAAQLPGDNPLDIVKRQVQALRDKGGTLSDPSPMADLKLAHPSDPNKTTYSLPSFSFTGVVKNGLHVRSHYAVTVLKDGSRAYVLRTCNDTKDVPGSAFDALETFAGRVTIRPEN
jgi:hypothetical protein